MDFRLEECLDALGKNAKVFDNSKEERIIVEKLVDQFPPTLWGRIDWNKISKKQLLASEHDLIPALKKAGKNVKKRIYVIWYDGSLPVIESDIETVLKNLYDVITVSSDTWLYCPSEGWVVEFHHDGEITLGFV